MSEFKVSMLASSSAGNATYIETPNNKVLVDAGLSGKKIEGLMSQINRSLTDVRAIFVTHEHVDHIMGVGVLARKYGLDIYANERTWTAMEGKLGKLKAEQKHIIGPGETKDLGDLMVESFSVSHDACDPQFYAFHHNQRKLGLLTDTGYVSEKMLAAMHNANVMLMESNHDINMLRMGSYAWSLKQRVMGDEGHLSNEDSALALAKMIGPQTKHVYLGHLSPENNEKALAHLTVESILQEQGLAVGSAFALHDTDALAATRLQDI